jgi:predicted GTPase
MPIKTLIMGAAGRDFHNFNTYFRGNSDYQVVAFTATQIPDIEGRLYPPELAGSLYPAGIPIHAEEELPALIRDLGVEQVVFSYSDVPHEYVMHKASQVTALGADFRLMGTRNTQVKSTKPVVSVCAVRTGSGKSQTTRRVSLILRGMGYKVAAIRHPMPYGNLIRQEVQRFADYDDLDEAECTIEEREEYEPHLDNGVIVYAGVDYEKILRRAEQEVDIILWDGGNNDFPFYKSDFQIVVADPHRPGHESSYYPGETNVRMADVFVINKVDTADPDNVIAVRENLRRLNPTAVQIEVPTIVRRGPRSHPWKACAGHRRRPDSNPRRDGLWGGLRRGPALRRGGNRGPAPVRGQIHRRHLPEVSQDRPHPSSHGLRRGADAGPGGHHQRLGRGHGDRWHADRPEAADQDQ